MSSYVETVGWQSRYMLGAYDWAGWLSEATDALPLPVYDLTKIMDPAAVWDIFYHGRHWPVDRAHELAHVPVPAALKAGIRHAGIELPHQVQYVARAIYGHCRLYTVGVPRIRAVPTDHMLSMCVVPSAIFESLAAAMALGPGNNRKRLHCWLQNVLIWGSSRTATIGSSLPRAEAPTGLRRRPLDNLVDTDKAQSAADRVLASITGFSSLLPTMWCTVTAVRLGTCRVTIALYARQPAPSDE